MAIGDIQSGYWQGPRIDNQSPVVRAHNISKTAWMDLYYDLYAQTHGEENASQKTVLADAECRIKADLARRVQRVERRLNHG